MLEIHDPFVRALIIAISVAINTFFLFVGLCILAGGLQDNDSVTFGWTVDVASWISPYMTKISSQAAGVVGSISSVLCCNAFYDKNENGGNFINFPGKILITIIIITIILFYSSSIVLPVTSFYNALGSEISESLGDPIAIFASLLTTTTLSFVGLGPRK